MSVELNYVWLTFELTACVCNLRAPQCRRCGLRENWEKCVLQISNIFQKYWG